MATLTDEEKAQAILGSDNREVAAEEKSESQQIEEEANQVVEENPTEVEEQEKLDESTEQDTEDVPPSFTKQFSNLKGDSWETYGPELEKAYQNSFSEALRLNEALKEKDGIIADLQAKLQAPAQAPETPPQQASPSSDLSAIPELQYAKAQMQKDMTDAFNEFAKEYPTVQNQLEFKKFTDASQGVYLAFQAANGRMPTYPELYQGIAKVLGWEPVNPKKDAAIKSAASQAAAGGGSTLSPAKRPNVSDAEVDVYLRLYPQKSRAEAVKDLAEVKQG